MTHTKIVRTYKLYARASRYTYIVITVHIHILCVLKPTTVVYT